MTTDTSNWEPKDIIVVATAIGSLLGTIVVQIIQPLIAAKRERKKGLEDARRELYRQVISHLDSAIALLEEEDQPQIARAFDCLEEARTIFRQHPIEISEDFRRACALF